MNLLRKAVERLRLFTWKCFRTGRDRRDRKRLNSMAGSTSILCCNCTGGILSHNLGLPFRSPTVNLYMNAEDFIRFCENRDYYLQISRLVPCEDPEILAEHPYPVAQLGDLRLFLVHYDSLEKAQEKWNSRKKRLNPQQTVLICCDREGMTESLKNRFEALPDQKVMFTHLPDPGHKSSFYISGYEAQDAVGIITMPEGWQGRRAIDQFDYVSFLNDAASGKGKTRCEAYRRTSRREDRSGCDGRL